MSFSSPVISQIIVILNILQISHLPSKAQTKKRRLPLINFELFFGGNHGIFLKMSF